MYELMSECGKSVLLNGLLIKYILIRRSECTDMNKYDKIWEPVQFLIFLVLIAQGTNLPKYDFFQMN